MAMIYPAIAITVAFLIAPLCLCQPFVVHPFADSIEWQREQPLPDIKRQIDLGICDSQPNYKRNDKNNVLFLNGFVQKIIYDTYIKRATKNHNGPSNAAI